MKSIGRAGFRAVMLARREGDRVDTEDVRGLRLGELPGEEVGERAWVTVRLRSRGAK